MTTPLESLLASGTKLWVDSIDPELVQSNRLLGATGATSNPVIISRLIKTGRFDSEIRRFISDGADNGAIAWRMTDQLVSLAQKVFYPVWEATQGDDGYVSFEVDPLLEDPELGLTHEERVERTIEMATKWAAGHSNRMIKVPATGAGIASLESLAAAGLALNVTLIFTQRQYELARDAIWRGAQRLPSLENFKSVYSIFVSRVDVYTEQHIPQLSSAAQGQVGIVGAKRIWRLNQSFWKEKNVPLAQEIVFASTGTKKPEDPAWKYVAAFAGSDIQTNPPATNDAVQQSGISIDRQVDRLPNDAVLEEIDREVNYEQLEKVLMEEGIKKFADPQKALLSLIAEKQAALS